MTPLEEAVRAGDPARFAAAMLAPEPGRGRLMALLGLHLELSKVGVVVSEPLLGEMRLQWWRDLAAAALAGGAPTGGGADHEVAGPLFEALAAARPPEALILEMIDARRADFPNAEPIADQAGLTAYVDGVAGALGEAGARMLGCSGAATLGAARAAGFALGAARLIEAAPALAALGRIVFPRAEASAAALAAEAAARLQAARRARREVEPAALPVLLTAGEADRVLRAAQGAGFDLMVGAGPVSDFRTRGARLFRAVTGRW